MKTLAHRKRIVGLALMTGAAVAIAIAALLFTIGHVGYSLLTVFAAIVLLVSAGYAFWVARIDEA